MILFYISIVGIDRLPNSYLRHKLEAETVMRDGGVPWAILRATQFHTLLDQLLGGLERLSVMPLDPNLISQPVHSGEIATRLAACVARPGGRLSLDHFLCRRLPQPGHNSSFIV